MKLNLVDLYGALRQAPRISEDRNKATCILRVARNIVRNGGQNKERNGFWDEVIIRTKDKAIVNELAKMEQYDIVRVKGVITVRRINRQTVCEHCGIKNITENKICYVEPIYVERTRTGFTEDAAEDFVFEHREVSNIARIIGDLTGPPKANDKLSIPACQYQIAVPRTYRIKGDTDDEKADFPLVKSYGKNAKEVKYIEDKLIETTKKLTKREEDYNLSLKNIDSFPLLLSIFGSHLFIVSKSTN